MPEQLGHFDEMCSSVNKEYRQNCRDIGMHCYVMTKLFKVVDTQWNFVIKQYEI